MFMNSSVGEYKGNYSVLCGIAIKRESYGNVLFLSRCGLVVIIVIVVVAVIGRGQWYRLSGGP